MKLILTLISISFMALSCSHLPGHYLTKRDPGFFDKKSDANVSLIFEISGLKKGLELSVDKSVSKNIFIGFSAHGFNKSEDLSSQEQITSGQSLYNMKGYSFRPTFGYYKCFGKENNLYWESYTGGGFQKNSYNIYDPLDSIYYHGKTNVLQMYIGTFLGWKFRTANIGFDVSYEHNWFLEPVMDFKFRNNQLRSDARFSSEFLSQTRNITSSFFCAFKVKKIQIITNAGWNIGYSNIFIRTGLRYRLR